MSSSPTLAESDAEWRRDRDQHGWTLPPPPAWPWRLPAIRWFRYVYHAVAAERNFRAWQRAGVGLIMNPYDRWILYALYRGWC